MNGVDILIKRNKKKVWIMELKVMKHKQQHKVVVYPGSEVYPMGHGIEAMPLNELCQRLSQS